MNKDHSQSRREHPSGTKNKKEKKELEDWRLFVGPVVAVAVVFAALVFINNVPPPSANTNGTPAISSSATER